MGHEVDHASPSSAQVKNEWKQASTPFMSRVQEQFYFIYVILVIRVEIFRHLACLLVQNIEWSKY